MITCRLCNKSKAIKTLYKIDSNKQEIQKKLYDAFKIELTSSHDPNNNFCCRLCLTQLNSSYSFYLTVVENQKRFDAANIDYNSIVVKVEQIEDKNLAVIGEIKVEKEENIIDFGDLGHTGFDNDESNDFKEDNNYDEEEFFLQPIESPSKKRKKSTKSKKTKKSSTKEENKLQPIPKDFLDVIYENENAAQFSDIFQQLEIEPNEMGIQGRIAVDAEHKYSAYKWNNYSWKCPKCDNESFENILDLDKHLKDVHKERFKTTCEECGIISSNVPSYVTHTIKYHNKNARFSCIICSAIFWNTNDLYKHCKSDHPQKILMCLYCGHHFNAIPVLKIHLIQHHNHQDNREVLICDFCNASVKSRQSMISHMQSHSKFTRLICELCGAIFNRRSVLEGHMNRVHHDIDLGLKCHCGKSFKTYVMLRKHKKIVHDNYYNQFNFECSICSKKFRTQYQLKNHLYSHDQNSSRYQCPYCDKEFRYTSGFQYHVRSSHTMEKPYGCPCCDMKFFDYANATKHVKVHGAEFKPIRDSK